VKINRKSAIFTPMKENTELLLLAKRVQAIAESGLHYTEGDYDRDRYGNLEEISARMIALITENHIEAILTGTRENHGYRTPKVDVRSVVFNDRDEILMVKERVDSCWSLPGGWCDVGYTPMEMAEKETLEEAGIPVKAVRVLAILDKKCHDHPDDLFYTYKIFIECEAEHLGISAGLETLDVGFFRQDELPELSTPRNTAGQIHTMFDFHFNRLHWPVID
jgi:ADP-ribose pyrophosphatase YjhB (NUDIX family)